MKIHQLAVPRKGIPLVIFSTFSIVVCGIVAAVAFLVSGKFK
jgi:hypothetical protein